VRIGSLFSGIGGLEMGLERAGLGHTVWQCESSPYARRVLAKHWPNVPCFEDVVGLRPPDADIICGGFPCQNLSPAGKRAGLSGEKRGLGLWYEYKRIIEVKRPSWVVIENVHHGWRKWVPTVRRQLAELHYESVPLRLAAAEVGAPHQRRRVFIVAHPDRVKIRHLSERYQLDASERGHTLALDLGEGGPAPHAYGEGQLQQGATERQGGGRPGYGGCSSHAWSAGPTVRGVDDGVPHRMDRLRGLGNAVVPQVSQVIGTYIREAMRLVRNHDACASIEEREDNES